MNVTPLPPTPEFDAACRTIGLSLDDTERQLLGQYLALLLETNKQFNLTAIREPDQAWQRHILDSLSVLPFLHDSLRIIDIGSGGGLPGIPLAITCPVGRFTLLEATGKKAGFLKHAAKVMALGNVSVVNDRAETVGQDKTHRQKYELAVARAVGPMRVMLEYALPLIKTGGRVLAMKGRKVEAELDEAGDALLTLGGGDVAIYEALPGLDDDAVIVEVAKIRATPNPYPRRPGEPRHHPL
jgi:16S rRNA (guanine527-N7)-methyltransferase